MTQQDMYLHRAAQGATLTPSTIITEPTYITHVRETIDCWCDADQQTQHTWFVTEMGGYPSDGPSIEAIGTAFQEKFYPNPQLYKIVDAYDAYLWRALADSERRMIDLINAGRPQKAVRA